MPSRARVRRGRRRHVVPFALLGVAGLAATALVIDRDTTTRADVALDRRAAASVHAGHPPVPTGPGRVQKMSLRAADAPGGVREVLVYRPGVPESADLPVVYFLHGLPGSDSDLLDLGAAHVLDRVFESGRVRPFVLVFPDGAVRGGVDSEWTDSADHSVRLESFVTNSVIAAVEGAHRRDRARRALAGFSMGGYGAMEIALRHPALYSQVASLAGYFHIDDPDHMFADDPDVQAEHDPRQQVQDARAFRLLLLDGAQDSDSVTAGETAKFTTLLREEGIAVTSAITPGGHSPAWALAQLPTMASFLNAGWPDPAIGNPSGQAAR